MNNLCKRLRAIVFVLVCVPFCGAWTVAAQQSEIRYTGGELISTRATELIQYTSKTVVENIATANNTPKYTNISGLQNSCGAVAGATIVGFYDKYYSDLIEGWDSYYASGKYRLQDNVYVTALLKDLYARMKTNQVQPGMTQTDFKDGLKSYVNNQGYSLSYTSLGSGNSFNYSTFKSAVKNNELAVLFVQPSNLYLLGNTGNENEDALVSSTISGNHIMVAFGYYEVKYTLSSGSTRTDKYINVATGLMNGTAFYKVGSYIDAAYIVKVS